MVTVGRFGEEDRKLCGGMVWNGEQDGDLYEWILARIEDCALELARNEPVNLPERTKSCLR